MIVCHERRFIFVAVNKTASSSIHTAFRQLGIAADQPGWAGPADPALHHVPAVKLRALLGEEMWNEYFKFAFVRNPWDRLVSFFYYLKHSPWVSADETLARESSTFRDWIAAGHYTRQTQVAMLCAPDGALCIDYLGHYETLEQDFRAICERLRVPYSLPHINAHSAGRYVDHYDDWCLAETDKTLGQEAARFGYVF